MIIRIMLDFKGNANVQKIKGNPKTPIKVVVIKEVSSPFNNIALPQHRDYLTKELKDKYEEVIKSSRYILYCSRLYNSPRNITLEFITKSPKTGKI